MKFYVILLQILVSMNFPSSEASAERKLDRIGLLPLGEISSELLTWLGTELEKRLYIKVEVLPASPLPEYAYNPQRRQYHSSVILNKTRKSWDKDLYDKILIVVDVDLFVPTLNFVFGEAESPGKMAIISLTRLRQEFYGLPGDEPLFRERVLKEALHELGHTYGMRHSQNPDCVMYFSNSLADTDRKRADFSQCQDVLKGLEKIIRR